MQQLSHVIKTKQAVFPWEFKKMQKNTRCTKKQTIENDLSLESQ